MVPHLVQAVDVDVRRRSTDDCGDHLVEGQSFEVNSLPRRFTGDSESKVRADLNAHPVTKVRVHARPAVGQDIHRNAVQDALRPVSAHPSLPVGEAALLHHLVEFRRSDLREGRAHVRSLVAQCSRRTEVMR